MQFFVSAAAAVAVAGLAAADSGAPPGAPPNGNPGPPPNFPPAHETAWVWFGRSSAVSDLPMGVRVPIGQVTATAIQSEEAFVSIQVDASSSDVVCITRGADGSQTTGTVAQGKVNITSPQQQVGVVCGHG